MTLLFFLLDFNYASPGEPGRVRGGGGPGHQPGTPRRLPHPPAEVPGSVLPLLWAPWLGAAAVATPPVSKPRCWARVRRWIFK